ncbi:uncharacterized protein BXZ73DRAFT_89359 [Epithele typhae]|uniref:uncharacterized protein n=1 Tax=Epithele typhae TaxID=378194 RepID=UPI0020072115|nr:uncharacterized protein BXZ73DRAFT_89359 [Epithele typhae]KAH9935860.1 hypothetical protein BXZ73DRAFT_89359 [Epithele typhae]
MSAKKLRSKLDIKFMLPLGRGNAASRTPPPGISADFSEKMFRQKPQEPLPPPPPPPPKDISTRHYSLYNPTGSNWDDVRYAVMASPISEDSPSPGLDDSTNVFMRRQATAPPSSLPPTPTPAKAAHTRSATSRIPVASTRVGTYSRRTVSSPEENDLRRREAQRRKELEEKEAMREEAERQARLKREKEQMLQQAAREDEARKVALEQELRRAAEERRKREAIEKEAEALTAMVAAERKRQEREKRKQETQKLQRMRQDLEEQRLAEQRERMGWRERIAKERSALASRLEKQKTKNSRGLTVLLTGWFTVQSEDLLSYKRRYFQLREDALILYKDAEDDSKALETIQLSRIRRIREAQDGFEDLQAIPYSFALEIQGHHDAWSMFTDSNEDKENVLALLSSRLASRSR